MAAGHAGSAKNAVLRVEIPRHRPSFESLLWERQSPRARILHKRAGRRQGLRARRKISVPASRNPSIQAELRKLLWERESPSSANSSTARRKAAGRAGGVKKRSPASRNPSIQAELRKSVMGAPKPLKCEFFISASEGGKARGRGEKSALLRVGILQYCPSFESLLWECQSPSSAYSS